MSISSYFRQNKTFFNELFFSIHGIFHSISATEAAL